MHPNQRKPIGEVSNDNYKNNHRNSHKVISSTYAIVYSSFATNADKDISMQIV
jgi:hypothetical protein